MCKTYVTGGYAIIVHYRNWNWAIWSWDIFLRHFSYQIGLLLLFMPRVAGIPKKESLSPIKDHFECSSLETTPVFSPGIWRAATPSNEIEVMPLCLTDPATPSTDPAMSWIQSALTAELACTEDTKTISAPFLLPLKQKWKRPHTSFVSACTCIRKPHP